MLIGERLADRVGEWRRSFRMFASILYEIYGSWILQKYTRRMFSTTAEFRLAEFVGERLHD